MPFPIFHAASSRPRPMWRPSSEPGLAWWFDARRITGLSDGTAVASWSDLSTNARNVSQGTAGFRPLYKTSRINGRPTVLFDGVDDSLAATFTLNQPVHLFLVINQPTYVANGRVIDGTGNTMGVVNFAANANLQMYAGGFGPNVTPSAAPHLIRALFNGASSSIAVDRGSTSGGDVGANNSGGVRLGAFADGTACSNTEFGEAFAFDHALTGAALTNAINYAMNGWGL